jgi:recombination protein RecA
MDGKDKIGNKTTVKVEKNKLAPPFKSCSFNIIYGEGIDKLTEMVEIAHDYEVLKIYGKSITYDEVKHEGDAFMKLLADNPELVDEIKGKIIAKVNEH